MPPGLSLMPASPAQTLRPLSLPYVAPISMARTLGMKLEFAAAFMILAGAGRALFAVAAFCKEPNLDRCATVPLSIAAFYTLLLVPAFCFAERKHLSPALPAKSAPSAFGYATRPGLDRAGLIDSEA